MTREELKALPIRKMQTKLNDIDLIFEHTFISDFAKGYKIDNQFLNILLSRIINLQAEIIAELANIKNVEL